ncbi:5-oxoprolinase subunit B family protein [Vibrio maerlii]|uniref:5-oxoprolinase subunit B family protein n=1 Tax=Vibrio maerlii TaxID=2231648 RepID=UPI000E3D3B9F|nr:allophanate hydrolase subunit 1 [Vibrio maerlii]
MPVSYQVKSINECSLLIEFDRHSPSTSIDLNLTPVLSRVCSAMREKLHDVIMNITPSYTTILVDYLPIRISEQEIRLVITNIVDSSIKAEHSYIQGREIELPCFYHPSVGLDISRYVEQGLTLEQLIEYHTRTNYMVCALGFAPGFAFMANVDRHIQLPRLDEPRQHVPKGSVGIANHQTAVYPNTSPGGWNIIGNCPVSLLEQGESYLQLGDQVTFRPISQQEFMELGGELPSKQG